MSYYRLQSGTIAKATFEASTSNRVENDWSAYATYNYKWVVDMDGIVVFYPVRRRAVSNKVYGYGGMSFSWAFSPLSVRQHEYLMDTFFATNPTSAAVTVMTQQLNNNSNSGTYRNWVSMWATMEYPEYGSFSIDNGWFVGFTLNFVDGAYAT